LLVYALYNLINLLLNLAFGTVGTVFLGVEPILFGVFCLGFDLLLIKAKHTLGRLLRGAAPKTT
ncbi:MAG: hypothetical protein K2K53_12705, partial [Oscillospiraceae bacterium]|nr:hypothetical protein [Oscillospiraceae bacterium]